MHRTVIAIFMRTSLFIAGLLAVAEGLASLADPQEMS
jgi:hypothetical protein